MRAPGTLPLNVWTYVALTWDGAQLRLYVDGALVTTAARTGVLQSVTAPLRIGGNVPYGEFFLGRLDEIRIYNRALSVAELQADAATPVGTARTPDGTAPTVVITTPTGENDVHGDGESADGGGDGGGQRRGDAGDVEQ